MGDTLLMKRKILVILLFVPLFITQLTLPAMAAQVSLSDIVVSNTDEHLLVNFTVTGCFTEDMNKAIEKLENITEDNFYQEVKKHKIDEAILMGKYKR